MNETIPAGLLPQIAYTLHVSESVAGQTISIYALATAVTAIPLGAVLARRGRRTVLVPALATFVVANSVIAVTDSFAVIMGSRLIAGIGAGLIWSNLAVDAARLVAPDNRDRAMSIANVGTPIVLSTGLPSAPSSATPPAGTQPSPSSQLSVSYSSRPPSSPYPMWPDTLRTEITCALPARSVFAA